MPLYALILSIAALSGGPPETYAIDTGLTRLDCYREAFQRIEHAAELFGGGVTVSLECKIDLDKGKHK